MLNADKTNPMMFITAIVCLVIGYIVGRLSGGMENDHLHEAYPFNYPDPSALEDKHIEPRGLGHLAPVVGVDQPRSGAMYKDIVIATTRMQQLSIDRFLEGLKPLISPAELQVVADNIKERGMPTTIFCPAPFARYFSSIYSGHINSEFRNDYVFCVVWADNATHFEMSPSGINGII